MNIKSLKIVFILYLYYTNMQVNHFTNALLSAHSFMYLIIFLNFNTGLVIEQL